jgi:hypothetical protein
VIRRALLAAFLAASCSRPAPPPAAPAKNPLDTLPKDVINEQQSLADIARGASIVSRTGESLLQVSALSTIDGSIPTSWMSPPHDFPQSITIGLAARSRIDRVGFRSLRGAFEANHLTFERSIDAAQWTGVAPTEAAYVRVTIPDAQKPGGDVRLHSLLAGGTQLEPPRNAPIDGCWSINGSAARFVQHGQRALGSASIGTLRFDIAGGNDGKLWRFQWLRGNDFGYALLTAAPDSTHLSALVWHEAAIPLFVGTPWFGDRQPCAATDAIADDLAIRYLRRSGRVSLFALQFDAAGTLDSAASAEELATARRIIAAAPVPLRIVAHEFRQPDARRNKAVAEQEIATLRDALARSGTDLSQVTFAAAGSDATRQEPESDAARAIYSAVDIEVRR